MRAGTTHAMQWLEKKLAVLRQGAMLNQIAPILIRIVAQALQPWRVRSTAQRLASHGRGLCTLQPPMRRQEA